MVWQICQQIFGFSFESNIFFKIDFYLYVCVCVCKWYVGSWVTQAPAACLFLQEGERQATTTVVTDTQ